MIVYGSAKTEETAVHQPRSAKRTVTDRSSAALQQREAWPDFARACAIILVVLFHSRHSTWLIGFQNDALADRIWPFISDIITPLRMPLFFLISGMLATNAVTKPWHEVSYKRVWNNLYIYVVWGTIYMAMIPSWPRLAESSLPLYQQAALLMLGDSPAWYLWALAVFFVVARFASRVPSALVLFVTYVAASFAPELRDAIHPPPRLMLQCMFFFFAGLRFSRLPFVLAARASIPAFAAVTPIMLVAVWAYHEKVFGIFPVAGIVCVIWGIIAASLATRHIEAFAAFGRWMGSRTLQVYVVHFLVLTALLNLAALYLPASVKVSPLVSLSAPLLLTGTTVICSLSVAYCLPKLKLGWLLKLPN